MLRFKIGELNGTFEDGIVTLEYDGKASVDFQSLIQAAFDYRADSYSGYVPGPDAVARLVLAELGLTITEEVNDDKDGVIY